MFFKRRPLKGNCQLELLLNGYAFELLDEKQKQLLGKYRHDYAKEGRELLGIERLSENIYEGKE